MKLNLPILERLASSASILISGAGGGHDVLAGLPLYFALRDMGKTVHLANYSFTQIEFVTMFSAPDVLLEDRVYGARPPDNDHIMYFPEEYLSQWFRDTRGEDIPVWMLAKTGAGPLVESYRALAAHLNIDALILVDGGVDSLMRGDEAGPGTLLEDSISLTAADALDLPVKLLACVGFGTEVEEDVCHYHALENIAALTQMGGYLGACALVPQMESFQLFEAACRYIWDRPRHPRSHITTRVIPAANGEFGDFRMYPDDDEARRARVMISPLMSLYWFFDAEKVIERNLLIDLLRDTHSAREAFARFFFWARENSRKRPRRSIPY